MVEQRGLAAAVGPDDGDSLPGGDGEVDALQGVGGGVGVAEGDVSQLDGVGVTHTRVEVGGHDLDAVGQAGLEPGQFRLDGVDGLQGVLAPAHDDHATDDFAFAVQVCDAAAHLRTETDFGDAPFTALPAQAKGGFQAGFDDGVITADTLEQAIERAGTKAGNKGWQAALPTVLSSGVVATGATGSDLPSRPTSFSVGVSTAPCTNFPALADCTRQKS